MLYRYLFSHDSTDSTSARPTGFGLAFWFCGKRSFVLSDVSKKVMNVVATLLSLMCFGWYLTHSIFPGPNCDPGTLSC